MNSPRVLRHVQVNRWCIEMRTNGFIRSGNHIIRFRGRSYDRRNLDCGASLEVVPLCDHQYDID